MNDRLVRVEGVQAPAYPGAEFAHRIHREGTRKAGQRSYVSSCTFRQVSRGPGTISGRAKRSENKTGCLLDVTVLRRETRARPKRANTDIPSI